MAGAVTVMGPADRETPETEMVCEAELVPVVTVAKFNDAGTAYIVGGGVMVTM